MHPHNPSKRTTTKNAWEKKKKNHVSLILVRVCHTPEYSHCTRLCSLHNTIPSRSHEGQRLVWSAISVPEPRLRSAMWQRAGSGKVEIGDWLFWAILSREWTMACRRQVIHCCLLKESLACRLYGWTLERPLLLTRKQFLTGRRGEHWVDCCIDQFLNLSPNLRIWIARALSVSAELQETVSNRVI